MSRPAGATAFLALWNGIAAAASQQEYETWHTYEHVPERVSLPGFVEALRYRSVPQGAEAPAYFTCYWLEDLAAMNSDAYRQVFATPTPWTARMRSQLTDFLRLPCGLAGAHGLSSASRLATLHLRVAAQDTQDLIDDTLSMLVRGAQVVAAQWGRYADTAAIPIANRDDAVPQAGRDLVVMLQGLEAGALRRAARTLQGLPAVQAASEPRFFELLTQVRRDALPARTGGRPPPRMDLFELFAPGDKKA